MATSETWNVVLRLAVQGAKGSQSEVENLERAVGNLNKEGKLTERQLETTSKGLISAGRAASSARKDSDNFTQGLIQQRYALYDVASTYGAYSAAVAAASTASVVAFAKQERAFTDVERTAEGSLGNIKSALYDLSTTLPVAFTDLTAIATLGNQLGVPAASLEKFTETVAAFSTATGITAEASSQAFGRIGNILGITAEDYDRLASAIVYTGRTGAATEKEIISLTERLGASASRAGFAADEVVGLAGALGSVAVAPERAQGVFETYFNTLNESLAEGGRRAELFAQIVGVSVDELNRMVRGGQGLEVFSRFASTLGDSSVDTVQLTSALSELGLSGLRANEVIGRISQRMPIFQQSLQNSSQAFRENTELQQQMSLILDDLASKWTTSVNAVVNLASALGGTLAPVIGPLLDNFKNLVVGVTEFIQTPVGSFLTSTVAIIVGATAAYAGYRAMVALTTASTYALITAQRGLAASGIQSKTAVGQLAASLGVLGGGSATAAGGLRAVRTALLGIGKATVVIGLLQLLIGLFTDLRGTVAGAGDAVVWFGEVLQNISFGIPKLVEGAKQIQDFGRGIRDWSTTLPGAANDMTDVADAALDFNPVPFETGAGNLTGLGDSAKQAAKQVRTLTDYAGDLASVWTRAFEIRFGAGSTLDAISTSFQQIRDAAEEARRNIAGMKAEISGIQADLKIQNYFLGIAQNYGDEKRAAAIRAEIAKRQAELASKTADLNAEQQKNNKTLIGNNVAAIANRNEIRNLVTQYQAHIQALASAGLSQEELKRRTDELRQDFIAQATQLGYNRSELGMYEQSFRDVKVAIDNVPRNITVTANMDPALQALNEFAARAEAAASRSGSTFGNAFGSAAASTLQQQAFGLIGQTLNNFTQSLDFLSGMYIRSSTRGNRVGGGTFAEGGYTGSGGMYEPAGVVHRGEYVIPKRHVNQATGLPYADVMGRLTRGVSGRSGYAGGGYVSGGNSGGTVTLSASSLQALAMILPNVISLDGRVIGQTAGSYNAMGSATGRG